jgi:hypothetical protein
MHELVCADNGVNRTGIAAVRAANTKVFIDHSDPALQRRLLGQRQNLSGQQVGQSSYGGVTAGRTQIDGNAVIDHSGCVWSAAWIAALRTLGLRQ